MEKICLILIENPQKMKFNTHRILLMMFIMTITKVSKSRKIEISNIKNNIGALIYSSNQAKNNFLIDDILNYETLVKLIIKENKFENYKIYENKKNNSIFENLLVKYKDENKDKYSFENICRNLGTNISVVIPVYLKDC